MATTWQAKVTGDGVFPFDMLRYDRCWPATESDATRLTSRANLSAGTRTLVMVSHGERTVSPFTPARWLSFGWVVTEVERR